MDEATRKEIAVWNLEKAGRMLVDAREAKNPETAVNRAYYAAFYAATALLATEGKVGKSHSGVRETFGKDFVHTGVVPKELSTLYGKLEVRRYRSDYGDRVEVTAEDAMESIVQSKEFCDQVRKALEKIMPEILSPLNKN